MAHIKHGTLTADTVATVTLDTDALRIEVVNRDGADEIYFLVDPGSTNPTVHGDDCEVLPAVITAQTCRSRASGVSVVKMISSGTPKYTVRAVQQDDLDD